MRRQPKRGGQPKVHGRANLSPGRGQRSRDKSCVVVRSSVRAAESSATRPARKSQLSYRLITGSTRHLQRDIAGALCELIPGLRAAPDIYAISCCIFCGTFAPAPQTPAASTVGVTAMRGAGSKSAAGVAGQADSSRPRQSGDRRRPRPLPPHGRRRSPRPGARHGRRYNRDEILAATAAFGGDLTHPDPESAQRRDGVGEPGHRVAHQRPPLEALAVDLPERMQHAIAEPADVRLSRKRPGEHGAGENEPRRRARRQGGARPARQQGRQKRAARDRHVRPFSYSRATASQARRREGIPFACAPGAVSILHIGSR